MLPLETFPEEIDVAEERPISLAWPSIEIATRVAESFSVEAIESYDPDPTVPDEIGALRLWRREIADRTRKPHELDALTRAAIAEANAKDEIRDGLKHAARRSRLEAAQFIVEAIATRAAGTG